MDYRSELAYPVVAEEKEGSALLWRQEDDKFILLARHDMYVMNEFSKEIFTLCDGSRSVENLAKYCSETYAVDIDIARNKIIELIDFAVDRNLMEIRLKND